MADRMPHPLSKDPDDRAGQRPALRFDNAWTGSTLAIMALISFSAAMSMVAIRFGWMDSFLLSLGAAARESVEIGGVIALILASFVSAVGFTSALLYGLVRTGEDGAVTIQGRRIHGLALGLVYLWFFATPWVVWPLILLFR
jgi:hypothetical protein